MTKEPSTVVVIGASVAEIDVLHACLSAIPARSGLAWLVVPLISAVPDDRLAEALQDVTRLPVDAAQDGMALVADRVTVVSPGWLARIEGRRLRIERGTPRDTDLAPVDLCLASLAEAAGDAGIGVVLSERAADCMLGLRALRDAGGLVLMGAWESAWRGGKVQSGLIDKVLTPETLPRAVIRLHAARADAEIGSAPLPEDVSQMLGLAEPPRGAAAARLAARVRRRMALTRMTQLDGYLRVLRSAPLERAALTRDAMQAEARFFAGGDTLESLRDRVLIPLLQSGREAFRVWVPGCGTGEMVYSLAMLLAELTAAQGDRRPWRLFGSDIDDGVLRQARSGLFPASAMATVSPERQARFFVRTGGGYQIDRSLREMCVFAQHNLYEDAPFGHLDLILCRNPLMFADRDMADEAVAVFHYALKPDGCLGFVALPPVEVNEALFEPLDPARALFRRCNAEERRSVMRDLTARRQDRTLVSGAALKRDALMPRPSEREAAERALLSVLGAAFASTDDSGRLLHYSTAMKAFLSSPRPGHPQALTDLQSAALTRAAQSALNEVRDRGSPSVVTEVMAEIDGQARVFSIRLQRFEDMRGRYLLVLADATPSVRVDGPEDRDATRTLLRKQVERLEWQTADSERALSSANRELLAMNEELQASNKQLAISREELEFINDRLQAYNRDLADTAQKLAQQNAEMRAIYEGVSIGLGLVDRDLAWARRNAALAEKLGLPDDALQGPLSESLPADLLNEMAPPLRAVLQGAPAQHCPELRLYGPDGDEERVLVWDAFPILLDDEVTAAGVAVRDVTQSRALAAEKDMLLAELEHRVKNMLAVVRAVTRFTAQTAADKESLVARLTQRLSSIGRTHELLASGGWRAQELETLAYDSLAPFVEQGANGFTYEGPKVLLTPTEAQALGLGLHELGTNAVKHGALSVPGGNVTLKVAAERNQFTSITWQEDGGPEVARPTSAGFGTYLLETILGRQLMARVEVEYAPAGVSVTIRRQSPPGNG